jgi:hypothetical protein
MKHYQTHRLNWRGVPLTVAYSPDCSPNWRTRYSRALAHFRIEAPCPLPITGTGFLSHLTKPERVYDEGRPAAFVLAWLDAAATPAWARTWDKARQLSLF